jgi:hypothetical protein
MNRHERRKAKVKSRCITVTPDTLHSAFDVIFESKGWIVMISANAVGQRVVEDPGRMSSGHATGCSQPASRPIGSSRTSA